MNYFPYPHIFPSSQPEDDKSVHHSSQPKVCTELRIESLGSSTQILGFQGFHTLNSNLTYTKQFLRLVSYLIINEVTLQLQFWFLNYHK